MMDGMSFPEYIPCLLYTSGRFCKAAEFASQIHAETGRIRGVCAGDSGGISVHLSLIHISIAKATVSQHLKELKEAGLIQGEIETPKVKYCINRENWKIASMPVSYTHLSIGNLSKGLFVVRLLSKHHRKNVRILEKQSIIVFLLLGCGVLFSGMVS